MRTELVGGKRRQFAHEPAKRRAGGGNDDDGIGSCGHGGFLDVSDAVDYMTDII
jgi:hypothetical protein